MVLARSEVKSGSITPATPSADGGQAKGRKQSLRGMGFEEQERMLAPPGPTDQAPVQRKEDEQAPAVPADDEMFDPHKHMSAMSKDYTAPTWEPPKAPSDPSALPTHLSEVKGGARAEIGKIADLESALEPELAAAEEALTVAREGGDEAAIEGASTRRDKLAEDKAKLAVRKDELAAIANEADADLELVSSPGTGPEALNDLCARRGVLVSKSQETSEIGGTGWSFGPGGWQRTKGESKTNMVAGTAVTSSEQTTDSIDLSGVKQTETKETSVIGSDGKTASKKSDKSVGVGADGNVTWGESTTESESDVNGQSTVKQSSSTSVGLGGASKTTSKATTVDGTHFSESSTSGISRGEGQIGASKEKSSTVGKVDGEGELVEGTTNKSKVEGGAVIAPDEVGGFGGVSGERESKRESGLKTGVSGGLSGRFTVKVTQVEGSDPPKYKLVLNIKLGASLGASVGGEKTSEGGHKGNVGINAGGSGSVTAVYSHEMSEDEAKQYLADLNVSAGGSPANGEHPEFAILAAGVRDGWDAAKGLYQGVAGAALGDAEAMKQMQEGAEIEITKETSVNGGAKVGGESKGGLGGSVSVGGSSGSKVRIKQSKKDGMIVFTVEVTDSLGYEYGAEGSYSGVSAGAGEKHGESTSQFITLKIDANDPDQAAAAAELAAVTTQEQLTAIMQKYPKLTSERGLGSTQSDTTEMKAGVGPVEVGMNVGASRSHKETVNDKGERTTEDEGANQLGGSVGIGSLKYESGSEEKLTGTVNEKGKASADVSQTDTATDVTKSLLGVEEALDKTPASVVSGGAPLTQSSQQVSGMQLSDADIEALMGRARSPEAWMKGMAPPPRLIDEWLECQAAIKAAGGNKEAVVKALSDFVGTKGHGRDDLVQSAVRGGGVSGGSKYEFPEGLAQHKGSYDKLVIGDPVEGVDEAAKKDGPAKAVEVANGLIGQLESLYNVFMSSQAKFSNAATYSEMSSAINKRIEALRKKIRVLNGGKEDVMSPEEAAHVYNAALTDCTNFKDRETALFDEIAATYADEHTSLDETIANAEALKKLRDLHAIWGKRYDEMAALAQEFGFGADRYWKYKPDKARFSRALTGAPGVASEAKPETEDKRKKETPLEPKDPIGEEDKKLKVVQQSQANGIQGQVTAKKNQAYGAGNKLHAWIQKEQKAKAIDWHNQGMEQLKSAENFLAKVPKNATNEDWLSYGYIAAEDFGKALYRFNEGLALYPPGWPPKQ